LPPQKLAAGRAEIALLAIGIFDAGGGEHDTGAAPAVDKAKRVPQFVEGGFYQPIQEQALVIRVAIILGPEPVQRHYRIPPVHSGSTKDVGENGNKEVRLDYREDPPKIRWIRALQPLQNALAAILFSLRVKGVSWVLQRLSHRAVDLAALPYPAGQV
jgi:hypothetical protein